MKQGLDLLYALQLKDDELKAIQARIDEIPLTIGEKEAERDARADMIDQARQKLNQNIEERRQLEKEILYIREKIVKYREQMKKVTTNKEYQGFISEIKFEEGNISGVEEKIIEKMVESDAVMETVRQAEADFKKIADDYNRNITDLKAELEYTRQKLAQETQQRNELKARVDPALAKVYENLFKKKAGKAVSFVATEFCGVCHTKVRPQILSDLVTSTDIMVCENCGRILFKQLQPETGD